ncbi:PREDICTED: core-binding factor subunit beta-like [Priapulus caudatus]|uniref:Core-binding factor subunit beta-like n=1 Tax=Priapulus caudatus TaxID=37621 RepID=A0ABM1EF86_PRICU|nr:PREDICTED: core-binding factor subunit beta-like [Priapulus caudatus]
MVNSMLSTSAGKGTGVAMPSMPRVVADQRAKFNNDELFRRLSRDSEVRFTGCRDRPHHERAARFQQGCTEGHAEIAFVTSGTNLELFFCPTGDNRRQAPEQRGYADMTDPAKLVSPKGHWSGGSLVRRLTSLKAH